MMTNKEMIIELQYAIDLIKQNGQDWLDERDIPILEAAISALQAQEAKAQLSAEGTTSDLISRQAAIDTAESAFVRGVFPTAYIRELPPAQPEIVRCKDCLYGYLWLTGGGEATSYGYCERTNLKVLPYNFCSKAERRTNGVDR